MAFTLDLSPGPSSAAAAANAAAVAATNNAAAKNTVNLNSNTRAAMQRPSESTHFSLGADPAPLVSGSAPPLRSILRFVATKSRVLKTFN